MNYYKSCKRIKFIFLLAVYIDNLVGTDGKKETEDTITFASQHLTQPLDISDIILDESPQVPRDKNLELNVMDTKTQLSSALLQRYFKNSGVFQRDIAEALFVSESTVNKFMREELSYETIKTRFEKYRNKNNLSLFELRAQVDKAYKDTIEPDIIEDILLQAHEVPLLPTKLRNATNLRNYFTFILNDDERNIGLCELYIGTAGSLSLFLKGSGDSNLAKSIYTTLRNFYRKRDANFLSLFELFNVEKRKLAEKDVEKTNSARSNPMMTTFDHREAIKPEDHKAFVELPAVLNNFFQKLFTDKKAENYKKLI